jgi:hypothetical protein
VPGGIGADQTRPGPEYLFRSLLSLQSSSYSVALRARSIMPAVVPTYMSRVMR